MTPTTYNGTTHCSMCPTVHASNSARTFVGRDPSLTWDPKAIAVCPVHDVAGPVAMLPDPLRVALGLLDA